MEIHRGKRKKKKKKPYVRLAGSYVAFFLHFTFTCSSAFFERQSIFSLVRKTRRHNLSYEARQYLDSLKNNFRETRY